jgi:hypothetical protein
MFRDGAATQGHENAQEEGWERVLWIRGFGHPNPGVQRLVLTSFCKGLRATPSSAILDPAFLEDCLLPCALSLACLKGISCSSLRHLIICVHLCVRRHMSECLACDQPGQLNMKPFYCTPCVLNLCADVAVSVLGRGRCLCVEVVHVDTCMSVVCACL